MKRRIFERFLHHGSLTLVHPSGKRESFGSGEPSAEVILQRKGVMRRLMADPEMAFGEAYMDDDWRPGRGGLLAIFRLYFANVESASASFFYRLIGSCVRRFREANSKLSAQRNIHHHYDVDSELFREFLDPDMQYSCAYFETDDTTLADAQRAKCAHIGRKLCLSPGERVLDIGCGWGGLALHLAETYDVEVVGLTLADDQYRIAQERAESKGLTDKVTFKQEDYRSLDGDAFDAVVSVGMFEHVGRPQYQIFFNQVRNLLRTGGRSLIHTIGRNGPPTPMNRNWITKYIFPGGYIPSLSEIAPKVENAGLASTDIEVLRRHYARTLSCWNANFQDRRHIFTERLGERFCRMWEFYLQSCEAVFRWGDLVVFQIQLGHTNDAVPVTRDYLYDGDAARPYLGDTTMTPVDS
ncbi:class I SAM-dependent methyltransferase [Salinisphaera sp. USBA-960]|uniref:class I SAM-dependent methyltransferase n=1 Tax=Salinisphaera orenii TaxID=856731 RepID=UPI000DBE29AE|nr:class I SAM-dependent methyltransferase [Salifodinibacter halophilus]NNC26149.1 class I SAM-dependent methyltransferase [Salifodinibacter halophilus]